MSLFLGVAFGLAGAAVVVTMRSFDILLRHQHASHEQEWLSCGKPCGYFYVPTGSNRWIGDIAMKRLQFVWLFRSPPWAKEEESPRRALFVMRCAFAVANIALLTLAANLMLPR
jgi:hypothetical protein